MFSVTRSGRLPLGEGLEMTHQGTDPVCPGGSSQSPWLGGVARGRALSALGGMFLSFIAGG